MAGEASGFLGAVVIRGLDGDVALVDNTGALKVTGAAGGGAIEDGDSAAIKANVIDDVDTEPTQTQNPLLVTLGAYQDFDTGAGEDWRGMVGIALPASGGAVIGGTTTNPVVTTENARASSPDQDGAGVTINAGVTATLAAANADRKFLSIKNNSGTDITFAFGATADANDIELADGESFTMEAGGGIYTGQITGFNGSGGAVAINVLEF
jgi:hypothetical protein